MASLTVQIPDSLAARLRAHESTLPSILEKGLRLVEPAPHNGYQDADGVLEFLARLPVPQEVLALQASHGLQERVQDLTERKREGSATDGELRELDHYLYLDSLVRVAKAHAHRLLAEQ